MLDEYGRLIQAVAFHILRNEADAEEVVLDTMVSAWRAVGSLRDPAALKPWLLRIAARHALSRRRKATRFQPSVFETEPAAAQDDFEQVSLRQALDRLPARMRACISLHYYAGLTVEETGTALGISQNTVKYHLKAGLERLRVAVAPTTADVASRPEHA